MLLSTPILCLLIFRFSTEAGTVKRRHARAVESTFLLGDGSGSGEGSAAFTSGSGSGEVTPPSGSGSGDSSSASSGSANGEVDPFETSGSASGTGDTTPSSGDTTDPESSGSGESEGSGQVNPEEGSGSGDVDPGPGKIKEETTEAVTTRELTLPPLPDISTSATYSPFFTCEPDEYQCPLDGSCIFLYWVCDGRRDCPGGEDEENCMDYSHNPHPVRESSSCSDPRYMPCNRYEPGTMCYPRGFWCDQQSDCPNQDDEQGCFNPMITNHPASYLEVSRGDTFQTTCIATGTPTPVIVWRRNWGSVDSRAKMTTSFYGSQDVIGKLELQNVDCADAGAYSCEALNAVTRVFARDIILTVRGC